MTLTGPSRAPARFDLSDRVILVTGAGGGIGAAIARRLADSGAIVCLADRQACTDLAGTLQATGARATDHPTDVTDPVQVQALMQAVLAAHGRIDGLINAAGVTSTGGIDGLSSDEWDRVHTINLKSVFLCCQAALAPMRQAGFGRIVNIGSVVGKNGGNARPWLDASEQNGAANAAYAASKAGVHALTLSLAKEVAASGVTVNAVAPGPIVSPMTTAFPAALQAQIPVGRMGRADEVAAMVAFLCSDETGFITGEVLDVNGGLWPD